MKNLFSSRDRIALVSVWAAAVLGILLLIDLFIPLVQVVLLLITAAPGLLVWGYGDRLTRQGDGVNSLLFFVLRGFLLLAAGAVILLRRCRYALIPLLIDRGCSAPLAVQVSIRLTRRRTGEWLNFWGSRVGQLLLCLVPGVSLWVRPRLHREYVLLLTGWLRPIPLDTTQRIPT